jgi:mRNA interferase MazF
LGIAAKTRPVLVVSIPFSVRDYALIQVVPHTTQPRGSQFEIDIPLRFLQPGVFNIQGLMAVPSAKFLRRLGVLVVPQMETIEAGLKRWLGLVA